jgi:hypothetical protein
MHPDVMLESNRRMVESLSLRDNPYLNAAHTDFFPACLQVVSASSGSPMPIA